MYNIGVYRISHIFDIYMFARQAGSDQGPVAILYGALLPEAFKALAGLLKEAESAGTTWRVIFRQIATKILIFDQFMYILMNFDFWVFTVYLPNFWYIGLDSERP